MNSFTKSLIKLSFIGIFLFLCTIAVSGQSADITVSANLSTQLSVLKDQDVNFATLTLNPTAGAGTSVTLNPQTGTISTNSAGAMGFLGQATVGKVTITGEPLGEILFSLATPITLSGPGGSTLSYAPQLYAPLSSQNNTVITATTETALDLPVGGILEVFVGGTLTGFDSYQPGAYSGTLVVSLEYN